MRSNRIGRPKWGCHAHREQACSYCPRTVPWSLRERLEGPGEVGQGGLRVPPRAVGSQPVREVLDELATGVEDGPLTVGIAEGAFVVCQRQLTDLGAKVPID